MGETELPTLSDAYGASTGSQLVTAAVGLLETLRPSQWYKQSILFVALVFSMNATDLAAWGDVTAGALLFSLVAGTVYLFNDVCDREEDRAHPTKQHRPIASGQLGVATAIAAGLVLAAGSLVAAWWLSPAFFAVLLLYVAQNAAYNAVLRDVLFVDVLLIGTGFVLRAIGGVVLLGAPVSPWLVLCTFLAALFLGFGKRVGEQRRLGGQAATRSNLDAYGSELPAFLLGSVASALLIAYSLYTFFAQTPLMMVTIPLAFYAVFRYGYLVWSEGIEDPSAMFLDRGMVTTLTVWSLAIAAVLYVPPSALPV
jgi:4-hydroxybenzoate polyprenyltransferase